MHARSPRRGATLVEAALALALVLVVVVGFVVLLGDWSERNRALDAASRLTEVGGAAQKYLKANAELLVEKTGTTPLLVPVARTTPDGAVPSGPVSGLPSLQGGGFLDSDFVDANGYGQSHAMIVRRVGTTGRLEAVVTTIGGRPIPDVDLGHIAETVGSEGGFVAASSLGNGGTAITGTGGSWAAPALDWTSGGTGPTAGHVVTAMALDEGSLVTDYLYRRDVGIAAANTMSTNLSMGGHAMTEVARVAAGTTELAFDPAAARVKANKDVLVAGTVSAGRDASADGDVTAKRFVDRDDPSFSMQPSAKSKFFDFEADRIDTDMKAYGTSMKAWPDVAGLASSAGVSKGADNRKLGSYLRHEIRMKKTVGPAGYDTGNSANPVHATAWCDAGWTRISCSGGRADPMADTCDEDDCGFVGAVAVEEGGRQGCQTVIDHGPGTAPVAVAFCMSNIENGGGAGAPSSPGPGGDEPLPDACPSWAPGVWPNCAVPEPKECPPWAPGTFPNCVFPSPPPTCPDWAPGTYPNCVVDTCPPWAPGAWPSCVIPEPGAPEPISKPVRSIEATAYCPSGYRVQSCAPDSSATTGHYGRFVGYFYSDTGDDLFEASGTYAPAPYTLRRAFAFGNENMSNAIMAAVQGTPLFTAVVYAGATGKGRCTSYNGTTPVPSAKILTCVRDQ